MVENSVKPIRVLLVDDHTMVRRGLATFLAIYDDLILAGEAGTGEEAIQRCAELKPDVVLMDMVMPGMDGVSTTRAIRQQFPDIQVLALTSYKEVNLIRKALEAGAIGYLMKTISSDELARAIRSAHDGRATLSPDATQVIVQAGGHSPAPGFDLTTRERIVLTLMTEGLTNTQIAGRLTVSPSTVKSHVSSILSKLGVASRTEAVTLALRQGLVT